MKNFPIKTPQQLGVVLQGYRKSRSLTQAQVGAEVGLAQKEISKLELDPSRSSLNRIFKLLAALNLELVVRERSTALEQPEW